MKKFIKVICVFLSVLMIFSAMGVAFFACAEGENEDSSVAVVYHCASGVRAPYVFGHTWIVIENISEEPLTVGPETIEPGTMISAGLHAAKGMVFNREMSEFRGSSVTAIKKEVTSDGLKKVESEIMSSNWNYYTVFFHNCTNFSCAVWKAASGQKITPFIFPFVVKSRFPSGQTMKLLIA